MHAHLWPQGILPFLSLPGISTLLVWSRMGGEQAVRVEKPLATNPEVQQLPLAFQNVTAFRPDAKRLLGFNLSVRSPLACQSSAAPAGAVGTGAIRQDAADTPTHPPED